MRLQQRRVAAGGGDLGRERRGASRLRAVPAAGQGQTVARQQWAKDFAAGAGNFRRVRRRKSRSRGPSAEDGLDRVPAPSSGMSSLIQAIGLTAKRTPMAFSSRRGRGRSRSAARAAPTCGAIGDLGHGHVPPRPAGGRGAIRIGFDHHHAGPAAPRRPAPRAASRSPMPATFSAWRRGWPHGRRSRSAGACVRQTGC